MYYNSFFIKALIERGEDAVKQCVDNEGSSFLHAAAWSGALTSIKARSCGEHRLVFYLTSNSTGSDE